MPVIARCKFWALVHSAAPRCGACFYAAIPGRGPGSTDDGLALRVITTNPEFVEALCGAGSGASVAQAGFCIHAESNRYAADIMVITLLQAKASSSHLRPALCASHNPTGPCVGLSCHRDVQRRACSKLTAMRGRERVVGLRGRPGRVALCVPTVCRDARRERASGTPLSIAPYAELAERAGSQNHAPRKACRRYATLPTSRCRCVELTDRVSGHAYVNPRPRRGKGGLQVCAAERRR